MCNSNHPAKDQNETVEQTVHLTRQELAHMGIDAELLMEMTDSSFWALGMLRGAENSRDRGNPPPEPRDWHVALHQISQLLLRVEGVRDAVVQEYANAGGTNEDIATAMRVSTAEAAEIIDSVVATPGPWLQWAVRSAARKGTSSPE